MDELSPNNRASDRPTPESKLRASASVLLDYFGSPPNRDGSKAEVARRLRPLRSAFAAAVSAARSMKQSAASDILAWARSAGGTEAQDWLALELILHPQVIPQLRTADILAVCRETIFGWPTGALPASVSWAAKNWSAELVPSKLKTRAKLRDAFNEGGLPDAGAIEEFWHPSEASVSPQRLPGVGEEILSLAAELGLPIARELLCRRALVEFHRALQGPKEELNLRAHADAMRVLRKALDLRQWTKPTAKLATAHEEALRVPLVADALRNLPVRKAVQRQVQALHVPSSTYRPDAARLWATLNVLTWYGRPAWVRRLPLTDRSRLLQAAGDLRVRQAVGELQHSIEEAIRQSDGSSEWLAELEPVTRRSDDLAAWARGVIGGFERSRQAARMTGTSESDLLNESALTELGQMDVETMTQVACGLTHRALVKAAESGAFNSSVGVLALARAAARQQRQVLEEWRQAADLRRRALRERINAIELANAELRQAAPWIPEAFLNAATSLRHELTRVAEALPSVANPDSVSHPWASMQLQAEGPPISAAQLLEALELLAFDPLVPAAETSRREARAWRALGLAGEPVVLESLASQPEVPPEAYPLIWEMALQRGWLKVLSHSAPLVHTQEWAARAWGALLIDTASDLSKWTLPPELIELSNRLLSARLKTEIGSPVEDPFFDDSVRAAEDAFTAAVKKALLPIRNWSRSILEEALRWD